MKQIRLKNVARIIMGQSLEEKEMFDVESQNSFEFHQGNKLFVNKRQIDKAEVFGFNGKMAKTGDILFSVRAPVGDIAILNRNILIGRGLASIRSSNKLDKNYLYYLLKNNVSKLQEEQTGTTFQSVNTTDLKNLIIDNISLSQQTAIANYLDHHTTKIDKEISLLEQKVEKLDEYKQALIYETVTKGLDKNVNMKDSEIEWVGMIPEHWEVKPLKKCLKERVKKNKINDTYITNNILSVMKDVGVINHKEKGDVGNKMSEDISNYKLVYPNDIVINKMNVTIGSLGISKEFGALSVVYMVFKETKDNSNKFFNYLFKSKIWQKYLKTMATGILEIRESVDSEKFFSQPLIVPDLVEQNSIVSFLDEQCSKIDKRKELINKKIELLKEYKQSLIYEAVTGKIKIG